MHERISTSSRETGDIVTPFRCPACHEPLVITGATRRCRACDRLSVGPEDVLDLVVDARRGDERAYYEREYAAAPAPTAAQGDLAELGSNWEQLAKPVNRALVRHLGDLTGRRVLLVGNGGKAQELVFLKQNPALLLFSDLAAAGVARVRDSFELGEHDGQLWFAALDALDIPLRDGSVDVVYGNAIVHHLPDRERFLQEVVRVLAPGGRAVFVDAAYSPLWQGAKMTVLRPLMKYSHRRHPRSPEDVRDTVRGGFREDDVAATIRGLRAEPWFERLSLAYYLSATCHARAAARARGASRRAPTHRRAAHPLRRAACPLAARAPASDSPDLGLAQASLRRWRPSDSDSVSAAPST